MTMAIEQRQLEAAAEAVRPLLDRPVLDSIAIAKAALEAAARAAHYQVMNQKASQRRAVESPETQQ